MASDLTKTFDISRQTPSGESLEELRQHYFIHANMRGLEDTTVGGLQVNRGGRSDAATIALKKQQQATSDLLLLDALSRQLADITNNMMAKYGDNFADEFAVEYLDKDTYDKIKLIQDPTERDKAFAKAINDGIKNGTIDAEDVYANPDFAAWLKKHDEVDLANPKSSRSLEQTSVELSTEGATLSSENDALSGGFDALFSPK